MVIERSMSNVVCDNARILYSMGNKFYFLYPAATHPPYSAVLNLDKAK